MPNTDDQIEVDLSTDDATLNEMDAEEAADAPPEMQSSPAANEAASGDSQRDKAAAVDEEIKKRLKNADGQTHTERASNAVEEAIESIKGNSQQLQQLKQQKQQAENRITRLEDAKERLEAHPIEGTVLQTLAGGISLEVPPDSEDGYDRSDLADEIDETVEALEERTESLDGQIDALEESLQQTQRAAKELQKSSGYMEALEE